VIEMLTGDAIAAQMDLLGAVLTLLFSTCFAGWAIWAWNPKNNARMEAAAHLPFEDGETS
jgi:cbb3-type cytochrome oxidase subunit 3